MVNLKIDARPSTAASEALDPHVRRLYDQPGLRLMVVGELEHIERTQPAPGSEKPPTVKVRFTHLEVPNADQEDYIREAQRALFLQRTARGTLQEDGQLELSESTLHLTGGLLHAVEAARLKVALEHWAKYARRAFHAPDLTASEVRHELQIVAEGLAAAALGIGDSPEAPPDDS